MAEQPRRGRFVPRIEGCEPRCLLSGLTTLGRPAIVRTNSDGNGAAAILAALRGGPGAEFATMLKRQVKNVQSVLFQFATGARTQLQVRGFIGVKPALLATYTGPRFDQFKPTAAGAVLLANGKTLSLGAIMDGPIDYPLPVSYTWALNLGRGARPVLAGHPGVTADTLITATRSATGAVTLQRLDLTTGHLTNLNPGLVKIAGPTIRLRLNLNQLGALRKGVMNGAFNFYSQSVPTGGIETVGAILGEPNVRIGSLAKK